MRGIVTYCFNFKPGVIAPQPAWYYNASIQPFKYGQVHDTNDAF